MEWCECKTCIGFGWKADPDRNWWQFWKRVTCPTCLGDGKAHPPGWPDEAEIRRLMPEPPPAPPIPRHQLRSSGVMISGKDTDRVLRLVELSKRDGYDSFEGDIQTPFGMDGVTCNEMHDAIDASEPVAES